MRIEFIPTLAKQRELYELPRDMARFRWYLETMLGSTAGSERPDVELPITALNPMGRAGCLDKVNQLIALDAERVAERAARAAAERLAYIDTLARVCLNVLDDAGGGWTNRYATEAKLRIGSDERERRANQHRRFVIVPFWTSESGPITADAIRVATAAALFRHAWICARGAPATLGEAMRMNGEADAFAGAPSETLPADELEYSREVLRPFLDSADFATQFAGLFGDDAAASLGYPSLGLPAYAGFAVAAADAIAAGMASL